MKAVQKLTGRKPSGQAIHFVSADLHAGSLAAGTETAIEDRTGTVALLIRPSDPRAKPLHLSLAMMPLFGLAYMQVAGHA